MATPLSDTSPEAEAFLIWGYRKMTAARKLEQTRRLNLVIQRLAATRIREQHPACTERELRLRRAALRLDRETMIRVFDWDPKKEGY